MAAWKVHMTTVKAAASDWSMPKSDKANITARFHGPSPPLEGTAMLNEPNTNATRPGTSPYAMPGWCMSSRVKGNA